MLLTSEFSPLFYMFTTSNDQILLPFKFRYIILFFLTSKLFFFTDIGVCLINNLNHYYYYYFYKNSMHKVDLISKLKLGWKY